LLDRGGRWFFNGHMLRPFMPGLGLYTPLTKPIRRPDFALTRLNDHPIFAGIDQNSLEESRGVAGFYGRGHNALPEGGLAVNGISAALFPIDWEWRRPAGGRIFSHAGNDLGGMGGEGGIGALLTQRVLAWCAGEIGSMSILVVHPGAYYHIESFEAAPYAAISTGWSGPRISAASASRTTTWCSSPAARRPIA
jgi:hypothetical protein